MSERSFPCRECKNRATCLRDDRCRRSELPSQSSAPTLSDLASTLPDEEWLRHIEDLRRSAEIEHALGSAPSE